MIGGVEVEAEELSASRDARREKERSMSVNAIGTIEVVRLSSAVVGGTQRRRSIATKTTMSSMKKTHACLSKRSRVLHQISTQTEDRIERKMTIDRIVVTTAGKLNREIEKCHQGITRTMPDRATKTIITKDECHQNIVVMIEGRMTIIEGVR